MITTTHKVREVYFDNSIVLECTASGNPPPVLSWEKDGNLVTASDRVQIRTVAGKSRLTISNAVPSNAGTYRCIGVNRVGEDGDLTTLAVIGASDRVHSYC